MKASRRGFLAALACLPGLRWLDPWSRVRWPWIRTPENILGLPVRWIEDDSNLGFVPLPPNPKGLIGYYELLEPEPVASARIIGLKDPYEDS